MYFFLVFVFCTKNSCIFVEQKETKMKNQTSKEYEIIFRDKDKNELQRKTVHDYSIVIVRNYAKILLANSNLNDLHDVIVKRVNNECN